jgi:hypothetical protein
MYSNTLLVLFNNRLATAGETNVHELGPSSFQNAGRTRSAPSDLDVEWNLQPSVNSMEMKSYLRNGNEEQGERTR